ncbi:MAG: 4-hydroxy-tetrahydrodipicolinate reductase [Desulfobacterales bacterium]|nr:4-hydroxy-tetrahydrodipicolinate reductase [Desulfobacterales bacterium]
MSVRVLVNGALGRMGKVAINTVREDPDLELAGRADAGDVLQTVIRDAKPDVVLDFTTASAVMKNIHVIIEEGVRPVIGTSGLVEERVEEIRRLCKEKNLGGLIVPNFSISAVLMMRYARDAALFLPDVEIIELHHDLKEDSPSATAIRTAELISENRSEERSMKTGRETIPGGRGANCREIPIHAVRLPGLVAHQEVIFGGVGQTLTIRGDAFSRECFTPGIRLACKKAVELDELYYGLEHIL